jgi:tetratricopeptide (TPR) repeat protein
MSLLIKALDKAEKAQVEKAQAEQQKVEQQKLAQEAATSPQNTSRRSAGNIANEQTESTIDAPFILELTEPEQAQAQATQAFARTNYSEEHTSERANNVFASKAAPTTEIKPIVWIVLFGLFAMLSIAGYFYYQLNQMQAPIASPVVSQQNTTVNPTQSAVAQPLTANAPPVAENPPADAPALTEQEKTVELSPAKSVASKRHVATATQQPEAQSAEPRAINVVSSGDIKVRRSTVSQSVPTIASESASIRVSRSASAPAVNPVLMSAYNAYVAGNDSEAQALYKRVLQRETHNVDALLGMAAIAERQNRMDDALGWYQKVLEADPKNTIALTATAGNTADRQTQALQLKSLIAQHPNDANAYANLGAYFSEQLQWPEAQQAYFEAFRLNASAENALNLAVSLDQMGKPMLALPYYQQALALVASSQSSTIDVAALQARMAAIQAQ